MNDISQIKWRKKGDKTIENKYKTVQQKRKKQTNRQQHHVVAAGEDGVLLVLSGVRHSLVLYPVFLVGSQEHGPRNDVKKAVKKKSLMDNNEN